MRAYLVFLIRNDRALPAAQREELAEKYASEAVQWLEKARSMAYLSSPSTRYLLSDDRDLDPLRHQRRFPDSPCSFQEVAGSTEARNGPGVTPDQPLLQCFCLE